MSSTFPSPVAVDWVRPTERREEYLIISELTSWISHWDPVRKRSRRCGGPRCYCCSVGMQKQLRVVVMVVDKNSRDKLLELRERHREVVDGHESVVGLRITVKREGTAQNSPVTIKVIGSGAASIRDIGRLVETFGLEAVVIGEDQPDVVQQTVFLEKERMQPIGEIESAAVKLERMRSQFAESADRLSSRSGG